MHVLVLTIESLSLVKVGLIICVVVSIPNDLLTGTEKKTVRFGRSGFESKSLFC